MVRVVWRRPDDHVLFAVHYRDGRSAYIRVHPKAVEFSNNAVFGIARDRQARGEIPTGDIVSVKRVH